MKQRFSILTLVFVLAFTLVAPAGAANVEEGIQGLSADNIAHVEMIFDTGSMVRILDSSGTDVTESFISENYENYLANNYEAILDCLAENNLAIEKQNVDCFTVSPTVLVNGSVTTPEILKYFDSAATGTQSREWIKFKFTGTYRVNDYNNTIDSGIDITGVVTDQSQSTLTKRLVITGKSWVIENNGKKITFTVDYVAQIFIFPYTLGDEQTGTTTFSKALS